MRELRATTQFKRDLRRTRRRGKNVEKLNRIVDKLLAGESLDPQNRPHRLSGEWSPCQECHVEPDWLLIWEEDEDSVTLIRTGTHSDLFE